jgi:eukaryotic-like serine/threonine-protein kinase
MPFGPGSRLGPYEVIALIGSGGMGEVYRARDTRLPRDVAIKVLGERRVRDRTAAERLLREARILSQLTHPFICQLFDVGELGDRPFLVMEYLRGRTLAERLRGGSVPLAEALRYGIQIADALDVAHRHSVVHRDLKPDNVMLTDSGVKLLDFGIASVITPEGAGAVAAAATTLTLDGSLVGTLRYMAPERLEGREADVRSDVFALGAVLYEMMTGRQAFGGDSQSSVVAAILAGARQPDGVLDPAIPSPLDHIVKRCLAMDPEDRWQRAADVKHELIWASGLPQSVSRKEHRSRRQRSPFTRIAAAAAVVALLVATVWGAMSSWSGIRAPAEVTRTTLDVAPASLLRSLPGDTKIAQGRPSRSAIALSPDGRTLVFSGAIGDRQQLFLRSLGELESRPLPETDGGMNPFFSPDGQWIGFWTPYGQPASNGELKKVAVTGGPAVPIAATGGLIFGASWSADDTIAFARDTGELRSVPASGRGRPEALTTLDAASGEVSHRLPHFLPDGSILFTVRRRVTSASTPEDMDLAMLRKGSRLHRIVVTGGADGRFVPTGHIVYARGGTLMAVPFDTSRQEIDGDAVSLISDLAQASNVPASNWDTGAAQFATSGAGVLAYVPGGTIPEVPASLVWVTPSGTVDPLPVRPGPYIAPRLSPRGDRVAVTVGVQRPQVWIYDIPRAIFSPLTSEGENSAPVWTPDGESVTFASPSGGLDALFMTPVNGSQPASQVRASRDHILTPVDWSASGLLAYVQNPVSGGSPDIVTEEPNRGAPPRVVVASPRPDVSPAFSRDGHWMAYVTVEEGGTSQPGTEVYVRRSSGTGPVTKVSHDGGGEPVWSRDGRRLFYRTLPRPEWSGMVAVDVSFTPTFRVGRRQTLFEVPQRFRTYTPGRGYDVAEDGRFLMLAPAASVPLVPRQIVFVQNWFSELRRRAPPD